MVQEDTLPTGKDPVTERCCPVLTSNSGLGIAFAADNCPFTA